MANGITVTSSNLHSVVAGLIPSPEQRAINRRNNAGKIFEDMPGFDPGTMGNKKGYRADGTWVNNSGDGDTGRGPIVW